VKLFAVVPLTWTVEPTFTAAPVVVNVAINAVTFVPFGTVMETVFAFSSIIPVEAGLEKEKTVMALSLASAAPGEEPPPPPPQLTTTAMNKIKRTATKKLVLPLIFPLRFMIHIDT
jgi:hypothetical protein